LRVQISVDYDGLSLSDTSSLASLDEYKGRSGSQISLSFPSHNQIEPDDDSVTVSSRDANSSKPPFNAPDPYNLQGSPGPPTPLSQRHIPLSQTIRVIDSPSTRNPDGESSFRDGLQQNGNPFSDDYLSAASSRYPECPPAILERLKLKEASPEHISPRLDYRSLSIDDRGAAWLRDQSDRTTRSMLGALPAPSISDESSMGQEHCIYTSQMGGDLALQRDPRGKYYYSYTSVGSSSQAHHSGCDDGITSDDAETRVHGFTGRPTPRPNSMHLNWLASQQILARDDSEANQHSLSGLAPASNEVVRGYPHIDSGIPQDVLQYLPVVPPPLDELTECTECGVILDAIRYVCTTCGEKAPLQSRSWTKGKGKKDGDLMSFTPSPQSTPPSSPMDSSQTLVTNLNTSFTCGTDRQKPLPSLPCINRSQSAPTSAYDHTKYDSSPGYELCSGCIESAGIAHAIEVGLAPASSPGRGNSPSSSQDARSALSQWIRSAPKQKGQLRHSYAEKAWGHRGWQDVGELRALSFRKRISIFFTAPQSKMIAIHALVRPAILLFLINGISARHAQSLICVVRAIGMSSHSYRIFARHLRRVVKCILYIRHMHFSSFLTSPGASTASLLLILI
jgi:hypothetical protein